MKIRRILEIEFGRINIKNVKLGECAALARLCAVRRDGQSKFSAENYACLAKAAPSETLMLKSIRIGVKRQLLAVSGCGEYRLVEFFEAKRFGPVYAQIADGIEIF